MQSLRLTRVIGRSKSKQYLSLFRSIQFWSIQKHYCLLTGVSNDTKICFCVCSSPSPCVCLSIGSAFEQLNSETACALPHAGVVDVRRHSLLFTWLPLLVGHQEQDHSW